MILNLGALTSSEIAKELNTRGYFLQTGTTTTTTTTPALPSITRAQLITWAVDGSLAHYGYPATTLSRSLSASVWQSIIDYAIYISSQIEQQYHVLAGLGGQRTMSGSSLGRMSDVRLGLYPPAVEPSWTSVWGPIILQMIGAAATIGGTAWQAKITRDQLEQTYQQTTGQTLGVPTQTDLNTMAVALAKPPFNYSQAEIATILAGAVPKVDPESKIPSWALPAGIGLVALMLMMQQRR